MKDILFLGKSGGISPRVANPTLDPDVAKSPIAALFSKPFDFKSPDKARNSKAKANLDMSEATGDSDKADDAKESKSKTDEEEEKSPDTRGKKRGRKSPVSSPENKESGKKSKAAKSSIDKKTQEDEKKKDKPVGKRDQSADRKRSAATKVTPKKSVQSGKTKKGDTLIGKSLNPVVVLTRADRKQTTAVINKAKNEAKTKTTEKKKSPVTGKAESPKKAKIKDAEAKKDSNKKGKVSPSPRSPSVNKQRSSDKSEEEEEVPLKTRRTPRARLSQPRSVQNGENQSPIGNLSQTRGMKKNSASKESLNDSPKKLMRTLKHTDVKSPMRGKKTPSTEPVGVSPSPQKKTKIGDSVTKTRKGSQGQEISGNETPRRNNMENISSPVTRSGKKQVPAKDGGSGKESKKATLNTGANSKTTASPTVGSPSKRTRGNANLSESETESPRMTRSRLSSPELIASSPSTPSSRGSRRTSTLTGQSGTASARSSPRVRKADMKENKSPAESKSTPRAKKERGTSDKTSSSQASTVSSRNKSTPSPSQSTKGRKVASGSDVDSQSPSSSLRSSRRSAQSSVSSQEKGVLSDSINLSPKHVTRASLAGGDSLKKTRNQKSVTARDSSQTESDDSPSRSTRSKKAAPSTARLKQSRSGAVRISAKMTWNEENRYNFLKAMIVLFVYINKSTN